MTKPIQELGPDARSALQALKAEHALEPDRHRAVLRRVEASIEAGAADPGHRVDALMTDPSEPPAIPAWTWAVAAAAVIVIGIWGFQAITGTSAEHDPRSNPGVAPYSVDSESAEGEAWAVEPDSVPKSVPAPQPKDAPPSVPNPLEPQPEPEPEPVESGPADAGTAEPKPAVAPRPSAPKEAPKPKSTGLSDEMALMRRARAALDAKDPGAALQALREHAQRHGKGQLVEDRHALQIIALCQLGKVERARKQAATFGRQYPRSHYRQRIASCLEKSSDPGDGSP